MSYFTDNKNFYPTPPEIAAKMLVKVDIRKAEYILEPSSGKGDLADFIKEYIYILSDKEKVVIHKNKGGHAMLIWGDGDFTIYPFQAGIPFYFRFKSPIQENELKTVSDEADATPTLKMDF